MSKLDTTASLLDACDVPAAIKFLITHNSSPNTCIMELVVHESFNQICMWGFTLRWRVAFLHEMDITVWRGSSLYPWETENPFIGWAWKPDWRKWIIGNRSVPAVIMLQRCCRTLPQRWNGMSTGCLFSLVSLASFLVVNTLSLPSTGLILPPCPPFSCFKWSFCLLHYCYQTQTDKSSWKFLSTILPCWRTLQVRGETRPLCQCCLLRPPYFHYPLPRRQRSKISVSFFFHLLSRALWHQVSYKKRHEINVMSMAFSHETPRHSVKVTLHSPLIPWQYCERWRMSGNTVSIWLPFGTPCYIHSLWDTLCWLFIWRATLFPFSQWERDRAVSCSFISMSSWRW